MTLGAMWNEVDGIAQILAAAGTLTLAAVTYWLVRKTRDLSESSVREATATEDLAKEARADRQLTWLPKLELRDLSVSSDDYWAAKIRNTGSGPAFDVVFVSRDMSNVARWAMINIGDLVAGQDHRLRIPTWPYGNALYSIFDDYLNLDERNVVNTVLMCTDVLGRRLRFGIANPKEPIPGEISKALPVEISLLTETSLYHLPWASEKLIWG